VRERLRNWKRRTMVVGLTALPAGLVRKWAGMIAGLMRFGGSKSGGEVALSRALSLLIDSPPGVRSGDAALSIAEIATLGMLGDPLAPAGAGEPPRYASQALERARLVIYLRRHGVDDDAIADAARRNRLPMVIVDQALGGRPTLTPQQVARRAGVDPEFATAVWHALGMPHGDPDEPIFTRRDVEAMRIIAALRTVYGDADLLETIAVMGRSMAVIVSAQIELFRRGIVQRFAEAGVGELEAALRIATLVDILRPSARALLVTGHEHHLEMAVSAESAYRIEEATGSLPGQILATVGFADLVGFTAASNRLSPLELGEISGRLQRTAETIFARHATSIVKTIGDAVMFAGRDPVEVCAAAVELVAAAREAGLDGLHVGIAYGPVLRRHADYFGKTVNIASRLCGVAANDEVLVAWPVEGVPGARWQEAGLILGEPQVRELKGLGRSVQAVAVRTADVRQAVAQG
jgi:adenylate cyclase